MEVIKENTLTEAGSIASGDFIRIVLDTGESQLIDLDNFPSGGGGLNEFHFKPGEFYYPSTNPAPLDTDSGTNGTIKRHLFDDSTDETVEGIFKLPSTLTAGSVTFEVTGYPTTAAADDIMLVFSHSAKADAEVWDAAYTDEASTAKTCSAVQDTLSRFTFTQTVATLGWSGNDQIRFKLTRDANNGSDTLSGDFGLTYFRIILPS